jgi:vitamin B12 transporter
MEKIILLIFVLILIFNSNGICSNNEIEEIVITANKIETPLKEVGKSVEIITEDAIKNKNVDSLLELLREIPTLDIVQNGGAGGNSSIFVRGANSEHTLILIDGIEINNPISPSRSGNLSNFSTGNIEKIEILKGSQSTIYGSDAIGGVINIITKKGGGLYKNESSVSFGSFKTHIKKITNYGNGENYNYSVGITHSKSEGFSAANKKDGNSEKDGYENFIVTTMYESDPTENLNLNIIMKYINSQVDIDNFGGVGGDDINHTMNSKEFYFKTDLKFLSNNEVWEQKLKFSYSEQESNVLNDFDIVHPKDFSTSTYCGNLMKLDWQNNFYLRNNILTFGIEHKMEKGNSYFHSKSGFGPFTTIFNEEKSKTTGFYLQNKIDWRKNFNTVVGIRRDNHDRFGMETTYELSSSYFFDEKNRIKSSYGTGFKSPSLFQLYSSFGNVNLFPESSKTWDIGFESELNKNISFGLTYFNNKFDNLIEFDGATNSYFNSGNATSSGIETNISFKIRKMNLKFAYVNMDTKNEKTGLTLLRRAKNKISLNMNYEFNKKGNLNIGIIHMGNRDDLDFSSWPGSRIVLHGYTLVNIGFSHDLRNNYKLISRIDNLFDEEYEEIKGYGTSPRVYYLGLKRNW